MKIMTKHLIFYFISKSSHILLNKWCETANFGNIFLVVGAKRAVYVVQVGYTPTALFIHLYLHLTSNVFLTSPNQANLAFIY